MVGAFDLAMCMFFGLIGTTTLHLAKAMERHGIEIFDRKKTFKEKGKKPLIWFIGFGLNNTQFIWQLFGNSFAPASVYVSVFGIGLVLLLFYSVRILNEKMTKWDWIGSGLIILGTLLVGFILFNRPEVTPTINYNTFTALMIASAIVIPTIVIVSRLRRIWISLLFGLAAGACGGIDNILKHSGLQEGNWWIIGISFAIGGCAFLITQWGFANKADASKLVPAFNATYIIVPIMFEAFIITNFITQLTSLQIAALIVAIGIIIAGMIFMTAIKKWKSPPESVHDKLHDAS
ncbi:MAG: EamA family transporter [Candidatus Helarchaeota archaeon]|nr:EamA family transporter [Candidatus Helarchaeota archaeon]